MDVNNCKDNSCETRTNGEKSDNENVKHEKKVDDVVPESEIKAESRPETETRRANETETDADAIVESLSSVILQENGASSDGGCLGTSRPGHYVDGERHGTMAIGGDSYYVVKPALQLIDGPYIYKMSAIVRGKLILVNNYIFDSEFVLPRLGSVSEGEYLSKIFTQLGFDVVTHENISAEKMLRVFQEVSADQSLANHDALIVMIMTHGEKGLLMGSDCHFANVETIIGLFNNYQCPQLIHKPKMFFIQACRGGAFDYGVIDPESAADAVPRPSPIADTGIPILPTSTDTLICYSTVEGYVSLRNESTGSWFGDAIGRVFVDHACEDDLETLLKRVNNRMLKRDSLTSDRMKQALEIVLRGWRKKLYFNPGIYEC